MAECGENSIPISSQEEPELTAKKKSLLYQISILQDKLNTEWEAVVRKHDRIINIRTEIQELFVLKMKYMEADFSLFEQDQKRKDLEASSNAFEAKLNPAKYFYYDLMEPACKHVCSVVTAICKIMDATNIQELSSIEIPNLTWLEDVPHSTLDNLLEEWQQLDLINSYSVLLPEMPGNPQAPQ